MSVNEEVIELVAQRQKINIEEIKEIFLNRNYRRGFSLFDEDKNGFIDIQELKQMINELNRDNTLSPNTVRKIMNIADNNNDGKLDYNEFVKMIKNPQLNVLFGKYLNLYVKKIIPGTPVVARSFRADEKDGQFEEQYKCWPPPVLMIIISIIQIIFYSYDMIMHDATQGTGQLATALMYNPHKRYEAWRYITYMFVHIGPTHLCVNLIVQILLGIPFEMVHKGWRILIIYLGGVLAGSLITSIFDPSVYLAGASGGVYALITAHIASIIMNWEHMSTAIIQLVIFLVITVADFGTAIYNRFFLSVKDNIGFEAHLGGAGAGLLIGIFIVRNLEFNKCETKLWWGALISFCILTAVAIIWNIVWPSYFPQQI